MRTKFIKINPSEKTNSNKLNLTYTNIAEDISELYKNYINLKNDIETHNLAVPMNTDGIEAQIESLQTTLDTMAGDTNVITLYSTESVVYPTSLAEINKCNHQTRFGEAILPIASSIVEYHYIDPMTGTRTLIDNVDDYVHSFITNNRYKPKVNEMYENSNLNAIDTSTNMSHIVKVRTRNSDISYITLVYNLDTEGPKNINTIRIYPVPELTCNYEDIIITKSNGVLESVKDNLGSAIDMPISNARKRAFRFPPLEVAQVSILLNTYDYAIIDSLGTKEFVIGSRVVSLEEITYLNEGFIGFKLDVPTGKTKIGKVTPVYDGYAEDITVLVYEDEDEFNNMGSDTYLYEGNASTIQNVINTSLNDVDSIYILMKLTIQDNNTTPIVKGLTVTWL